MGHGYSVLAFGIVLDFDHGGVSEVWGTCRSRCDQSCDRVVVGEVLVEPEGGIL